jgi:hypothetical protein
VLRQRVDVRARARSTSNDLFSLHYIVIALGRIDLLLHLLSNICDLPVTKSVVKESGLGKAIGSVEKRSACKGTPNEGAIKERVQKIKDAWNASVKARKAQDSSKGKRAAESSVQSPTSAKRIKTVNDSSKKSSAFSSLMKKVSSGSPKSSPAGNGGKKLSNIIKDLGSAATPGKQSSGETHNISEGKGKQAS